MNSAKKVAGFLELNEVFVLSTQIAFLTNMLKVVMNSSPAAAVSSAASTEPMVIEQNISPMDSISCVYYGGGHLYEDSPNNPISANYVGNYDVGNYNRGNNPYSTTYNP